MANEQRVPLSRTLPLAGERHALAEIEQHGLELPCHVTAIKGSIVTVAFDCTAGGGKAPIPAATMPVAGPEYVRPPIQVGCKGIARPATVDIGIVTGLGPANSLSDLSVRPANLAALVFEPVGNASWTPSPNANALVLYGAGAGVIMQDIAGASPNWSVSVNSNGVTIKGGGKTWSFTASGLTLDTGVVAETHEHGPGTYVAGSSAVTGESGEPVSG